MIGFNRQIRCAIIQDLIYFPVFLQNIDIGLFLCYDNDTMVSLS
jgi:hypothetical protein